MNSINKIDLKNLAQTSKKGKITSYEKVQTNKNPIRIKQDIPLYSVITDIYES